MHTQSASPAKNAMLARAILASAFLLLAACQAVPPPNEALTANMQLIIFKTAPGPFCGRCETIEITALSDGRVWIETGYYIQPYRDWRIHRRTTRISPEQFTKFQAHLQPYRPASSVLPVTDECITDFNAIVVEWRGGGPDAVLSFDFGCDPGGQSSMAKALKAGPYALGIPDLKLP